MAVTNQADTDVMRVTIGQIESQVIAPMKRELKQLNTEMQTLFSTWKGDSSGGAQRQHARLSQDYEALNAALEGITQLLHQNLNRIASADASSTVRG